MRIPFEGVGANFLSEIKMETLGSKFLLGPRSDTSTYNYFALEALSQKSESITIQTPQQSNFDGSSGIDAQSIAM